SGASNAAINNLIFGNTQNGIDVSNGNGNVISGNQIFSNGGLGISLHGAANNSQAPPVLTSVTSSGGFIAIQGAATGPANTSGFVEFFASDSCDASGSGEGQVFLGSLPADFGSNGSTSGNPRPLVGTVAAGKVVTATTTDANNNTSGFSVCRVVT